MEEGNAMGHVSTAVAILRSVTHGPAWHGDAVMTILNRVTHEQAAARPLDSAHSIWEILNHMIAWSEYAERVLAGGDAATLQGDQDWPPVRFLGADEWQASVERFQQSADRIIAKVGSWTEAQLGAPVQDREFTFKVLVHGIAHHNLYHSGQIGVLLAGLRQPRA